MKITVIGSGYVGLVSGTCLAELGNNVICLDIDKNRIRSLKKASIPFYEPGLEDLIQNNISKDNLSFTNSYKEALSNSDVVFLCVGTPEDKSGRANLSYLENAVGCIAEYLQNNPRNLVLFIKSTVPSGTCNLVQKRFEQLLKESSSQVTVASNPEFLKEGAAIQDFMSPDRIIVGTDSKFVEDVSEILYRPVNWKSNRLKFVSIESAEIIKYASNSFLATKISFINEIAKLCEKVGADINEVREGMGTDPRIGNSFLYAGLGFGGSCFPKDLKALENTFLDNELESLLLRASLDVNNLQTEYFINKILAFYNDQDLSSKVICVWGLSFKPETDDIRESISIKMIKTLAYHVKHISVYDPIATDNARKELETISNITFQETSNKAIDGTDALIIATEWREFWNIDVEILSKLKDKVIFDGRNILDKEFLTSKGFSYFGVGR